ncbi:MAG: hypothetical protein GX896_10070 [Clostridiales bacterium]|nr:hypothetical protein [Clostridiales bacterium]
MKIFKAHYIDDKHDMCIDILNTGTNTLLFTIDEIEFSATSFGYFELSNSSDYEKAKGKFEFLKAGGYSSLLKSSMEYTYFLQRYKLTIEIPVVITKTENDINSDIEAMLNVEYKLIKHDENKPTSSWNCDDKKMYTDDCLVLRFSLSVEDFEYNIKENKNCLDFEVLLLELIRKTGDKYKLKCCFTCQYSDYSPYGCDGFGTMECYRKHKEEYLKVNDKPSYFEYLEGLSCEMMQETFLCDKFEQRTKCKGYRGFVI